MNPDIRGKLNHTSDVERSHWASYCQIVSQRLGLRQKDHQLSLIKEGSIARRQTYQWAPGTSCRGGSFWSWVGKEELSGFEMGLDVADAMKSFLFLCARVEVGLQSEKLRVII